MTLILIQLSCRESIIHGYLDAYRVPEPALPMLFGETIAAELDNGDTETILV